MADTASSWSSFWSSPVGKKIVTGITGLALTGFVLTHMLGNLTYFISADAYNLYGHKITTGFGLGKGVYYLIEIALAAFFLFHIINGIIIWLGKRKARPEGYQKYQSAGGASKQSLSSRTMIVTGLVLLAFLVVHLEAFRFGEYIMTTIDGEQVRNLAILMEQKFSNPLYAFGYPVVMLLLGFHLRHGVWSAFQSLSLANPRSTPMLYALGGVLGLIIALGFLVLPLYIFFTVS